MSELLLTKAFEQPQQCDTAQTAPCAPASTEQANGATKPAAAAAMQPAPSIDPVLVMFGGRRSPVRDRVLRASWDKQQQRQRQQQLLSSGWTQGAAAATTAVRGPAAPAELGDSANQVAAQRTRMNLTPEPYLYSRRTDIGSSCKQLPPLPHGNGIASAAAAGHASASLPAMALPVCQGAVLQQFASSCTKTVNAQATAAAAAGWMATAAGSADSASAGAFAGGQGSKGKGGTSSLGLKAGEVERLIAR